jgi:hypothetical protein
MLNINQTFGVLVLVLSTESSFTRDMILKLAETVQTKERAALPQSIITGPTKPVSTREVSQFTISGVFCLLQEIAFDLTRFWEIERVDQDGGRMLETLLSHLDDGSHLVQAAYWLVLRLSK